MNATYLHSFENPDKHGIDEEDAGTIVRLLRREFPNVQFSHGVINGVLGIRIERDSNQLRSHNAAVDLVEFQAFVKGCLATRNLWER
jgi:hypothetical protein